MNKPDKKDKSQEAKPLKYADYVHPSAHDYLPKEKGLVQDVRDEEKGTFDTSELEGEAPSDDEEKMKE